MTKRFPGRQYPQGPLGLIQALSSTYPPPCPHSMNLHRALGLCLLAAVPLVLANPLSSQESSDGGVRIIGPPPPVPPEVMSRDERGGATLRAVRLTERPTLDGQLDEEWYHTVPPSTGFIQSLPDEGAPATEETEVWIGFDDENIYVSARVWDSAPESEWIANEMRRNTTQLRQNDTFGVVLDTFYDRRNAVTFYANALGAMADFSITNEGNFNPDWNPVWDARTGRFDGGWTVEMEIPFKSLRYRPGSEQVWGIQLRRVIRHKNEWAHLTPVSRAAAGPGSLGIFRVSAFGTLAGIEAPPPSRNLEAKPYATFGLRTERADEVGLDTDSFADVGLDVKYGLTQNLTLDLTYNTDFAQVEVDEQQVNLTRFDILFPEKRDFFLEGRGIFGFALRPGSGGGASTPNTPVLFFSRRIGLHDGEPVPIRGGARVTGKAGPFDVGALSVQTGSVGTLGVPTTNFNVLRLRRDVLERSSVGMLFADRSNSLDADGANRTYGGDASLVFFEDMSLVGYYARTETPGMQDENDSYLARFAYDADRWGLGLDHLLVGAHFNPEMGFLRRADFRQSLASGRFSPRPASLEAVRKFTFQGNLSYITNARTGIVETRDRQLDFRTELENSDLFTATFTDVYEALGRPFTIPGGVTIPAGQYSDRQYEIGYNFGLHRPYSGNLNVQYGGYYGGQRTSVSFDRGRIGIRPQLSLEPGVSFNWVEHPEGNFATHLAVTRVNYSFSPRMYFSGLVQYNTNTETLGSNLRFRWEYAPGSELFIVYTDDRNMAVLDRFSELSNRGLVIKVNRLLRI